MDGCSRCGAEESRSDTYLLQEYAVLMLGLNANGLDREPSLYMLSHVQTSPTVVQ